MKTTAETTVKDLEVFADNLDIQQAANTYRQHGALVVRGLMKPYIKKIAIEGQAGDSIFFSVKTIHGSKENHSDKARPVFIHRYRRADDYVVVGATTTANRSEAEKKAPDVKKRSQLGFMVSGVRRYAD